MGGNPGCHFCWFCVFFVKILKIKSELLKANTAMESGSGPSGSPPEPPDDSFISATTSPTTMPLPSKTTKTTSEEEATAAEKRRHDQITDRILEENRRENRSWANAAKFSLSEGALDRIARTAKATTKKNATNINKQSDVTMDSLEVDDLDFDSLSTNSKTSAPAAPMPAKEDIRAKLRAYLKTHSKCGKSDQSQSKAENRPGYYATTSSLSDHTDNPVSKTSSAVSDIAVEGSSRAAEKDDEEWKIAGKKKREIGRAHV